MASPRVQKDGLVPALVGGSKGCDQIDFTIILKRKSTFYVFNLLVPCHLISIIACLCYVVPPHGGDRITLLLTTFLATMVFVLVVLEIMPEESTTLPLFSQFLLIVMLLNMLQIFYCTFVCGLNSMDRIGFGPPKCLVTCAKCLKCCTTQLCQKSPNKYTQKGITLEHLELKCNGTKLSTSEPLNIEGVMKNAKTIWQINGGHDEINHLGENTDIVADTLTKPQSFDNIKEQNIKEWRELMKAVDAILFILNFLGLTGYFVGILVIYN